MFWIWWLGALGAFLLFGWLNRRGHGLAVVLVAALWPLTLPVLLANVLARRIGQASASEPHRRRAK